MNQKKTTLIDFDTLRQMAHRDIGLSDIPLDDLRLFLKILSMYEKEIENEKIPDKIY